MSIDVRRSAERMSTRIDWLDSHHSFSFGQHYDARNTHFGVLLVSNDDVVKAGAGFETHPHRDMEIVTWVLEGSLVHQDSQGHNGVIYPGLAQRMSAGTGITHSEKNDAWTLNGDPTHTDDVHFVQMWVVPDTANIVPGYEQLDINAALAEGGLVPVASGRPGHDAAIRIQQRHAALHAARLTQGEAIAIPDAPFVHVFAAKGAIDLEGAGVLEAGDAARVTSAGEARVTAVNGDAEILVWEMDASLQ